MREIATFGVHYVTVRQYKEINARCKTCPLCFVRTGNNYKAIFSNHCKDGCLVCCLMSRYGLGGCCRLCQRALPPAYRLPYDVLNIKSLPEHLKRRKKTVRNHKHVYRKVVAYLEEQQIPPSLKQAARFAQVSPGYLEYRFPSLVRRIVERYQAYRYQATLVNRYRPQAAALQFLPTIGMATLAPVKRPIGCSELA